jgi:hypothetical protein
MADEGKDFLAYTLNRRIVSTRLPAVRDGEPTLNCPLQLLKPAQQQGAARRTLESGVLPMSFCARYLEYERFTRNAPDELACYILVPHGRLGKRFTV